MSELAKDTTRTGFNLLIGQGLSTLVLAFGSIILVRLLLVEGYGIYSISLIPLNILQLVRDWGVPVSVQQRVSKAKAQGNATWSIIKAGLVWESGFGVALSLLLLILALPVTQILHREEILILLIVSAPILASLGSYNVAQAAFVGLGKSSVAAILLIMNSTAKISLTILLVILGFGPEGAIAGFSISSITICGISFIFLGSQIDRQDGVDQENSLKQIIPDLMRFSFPIGLAYFAVGIISNLIQLTSAGFVTDYEFGIYSAALNLYSFLSIPFVPIFTTFLSMFTVVAASQGSQEKAFEKATQVSALFMGSISIIFIISSQQIVSLLYGVGYEAASSVFAIMCLAYLIFAPLGSMTLGPLLMSTDRTTEFSIVNLLTLPVVIAFTLLTIPIWGIIAIVYSSILTVMITTLGMGLIVNRLYGIRIINQKSGRMLASLLVSFIVGIIINQSLSDISGFFWIVTTLIMCFFIPILIVKSGSFTLDDANHLVTASGDNRLLVFVFSSVQKFVKRISSNDTT